MQSRRCGGICGWKGFFRSAVIARPLKNWAARCGRSCSRGWLRPPEAGRRAGIRRQRGGRSGRAARPRDRAARRGNRALKWEGVKLRRTKENNWSTQSVIGVRLSALLSQGGRSMEITAGLRDLVVETAEVLSGAERRRFMANTLHKLRLGQREAAGLFGWGRDTLPKAYHEMS